MIRTAIDRFLEHPSVYLSMPIIAAIVGYTTKLMAIKMIFDPVEYKGVWKLGWQGIVPRSAGRMASIAVDTLARDLIDPRELIGRLDVARMAKEVEAPMNASIDRVVRELMLEYQPGLWESMPEVVRQLVINRIRGEAPRIMQEIFTDIQQNLEEVFDFKHTVVTALVKDKRAMNELIRRTGAPEMRFIARSGIYFGLVIGFLQAATYAIVHQGWVLPAYGLFIGFFTDWLALRMLFYPREPTRYLGITFHGLFLRRQQDVAVDYSEVMADQILTPAVIFEGLLNGPASDRLFQLVQVHVNHALERQTGPARPLVVLAFGSRKYQEMKKRTVELMIRELPDALTHAQKYAADAIDVRGTIVEKMKLMTSTQFERLLRPAFEQDEWKVIAVGGVLGFVVGLSQDLFIVKLMESVPWSL